MEKNAEEFGLMVELGMPPAAALRSATSAASELLGLDKSIGVLAPGFEADVVAVPGTLSKTSASPSAYFS